MSSSSPQHLLTPLDFAVVGFTLLFSSVVGIYHGFNTKAQPIKKTHENADDRQPPEHDATATEGTIDDDEVGGRDGVFEYFLAGRTMSMIPVTLSFFATTVSTLSVIGPAMEVYGFGLSFGLLIFANIPSALLVTEIFVPLFYNMRSMNIYKFLEFRYNRRMKEVITILFTLRSALIGSAIIYGTSVAFTQVTNINLWIFIGTITGVCLVYTTLGGIRGVMWVDVFQAIIMVSSIVVLTVMGIYHVGGVTEVWNSNYDTGRMDIFVFDLNPTTRHTVWSNTIGIFVVLISTMLTSQANIHRFLTAPTVQVAKKSSYVGFFIQSFALLLSIGIGCIMYAEFHGCDPLTAKTVQNMNQLVPKFVANVLGPYPVLPGLFFAGLLSACLSTMSSVFNSLSAILMETFIQPIFPEISDRHATCACHLLGIFVGCLITVCVLVAESFPNVVQASVSCSASLDGPLLGILLIGIFAPQAKAKVVAVSFLGGVLTTLWIVAGTLIVKSPLKMKPMFTDKCPVNETISLNTLNGASYTNISQLEYYNFENSTTIPAFGSPWSAYFPLHGVTFQWLALIGLLMFSLLFATLSTIFGIDESNHLKFDPLDFIPKNVQLVQQRLPKVLRRVFMCDVYGGSGVQDNDFALKLHKENQ